MKHKWIELKQKKEKGLEWNKVHEGHAMIFALFLYNF